MHNIIQQIESLTQNSLLTTIAGGSIIVWLISNIRILFGKIIDFINQLISFTITNYYEDNRGQDYTLYLRQSIFNSIISGSKIYWERVRNLDLSVRSDIDNQRLPVYMRDDEESNKANTETNLFYGFSIRNIFGKLCVVNRSVQDGTQKIMIHTSIRVYFASKKKFIKKLEDEINRRVILKNNEFNQKNYTRVFTQDGMLTKYKRNINSIFTNNDEHICLLNDIKNFIKNRDIYEKLNYPYKYSAIMYGNPGCGKTSTILAIASELNMAIRYVNLSTVSVDRLSEMMNNDSGSIFVFEDIDAIASNATGNRDNCSVKKVDTMPETVPDPTGCSSSMSLADLLNLTDGLLSIDGSISFFTTNHIEKLDAAFLRAGRMNKTVEFTYLNSETANKMIETYLGYKIDDLQDEIKPAELQEEILQIKLGKSSRENLEKKFKKQS